MNNLLSNDDGFIKGLKTIHIALSLGITFFLLIVVVLQYGAGIAFTDAADKELENILDYVITIIVFVNPVAGIFIFDNKVKKINSLSLTVPEKKEAYRSAFIKKSVFIEAAAFFAIVGFMIFGSILFLSLAVIALVFFIFQHPAVYKVSRDLNLKPEDLG